MEASDVDALKGLGLGSPFTWFCIALCLLLSELLSSPHLAPEQSTETWFSFIGSLRSCVCCRPSPISSSALLLGYGIYPPCARETTSNIQWT